MDASTAVSSVNFSDQIGTSLIVVWVLEKLKRWARTPWIDQHTDWLNRALSVLLGSVAAAGVVWSFDPQLGRLIVDGLTPVNAATFLWIVLKQVAFQEGVYRGLVKPAVKS